MVMAQKLIELDVLHKEFEELIRKEQAAEGANQVIRYTKASQGIAFALAAKVARHMEARIEKRLLEMAQQPFKYEGVHNPAKTYAKGTFVTHRGGMWHANEQTASTPGADHSWTLAVKPGRDGKDSR
jgi:hypothetical protein